ncbi:phosphoglycolate phosphatase [Paracoccus sp. S-4012]|uniref:phosphoglycolate phosphatase n=1 Tax=Paracoccus sp. S-4012 TaxID=2665648 RepID=UPI0012AFEDE0|nr:phosphoglycolate phosphatase [Paracoccus sp. S-4012]MRX50010.1 phosphoglycolate phosphatase [Paracoccus sp. S-4012]
MSAVVFDLDGTLVDSAPDMHAAMNRVLEGRGHEPLELDQVRGFIGNGVPTLVRRVMAAVEADEGGFDGWHGDYMQWYAKLICDKTQPYASVIEALDSLKASGRRLGICTNKPQQLTEDLVAALGLADRFGAVIGGDTEFGHKPAPGPLTETVRRLGGGPAVMVGDSMADAGAARAAGLPLILYTGGYRDRGVDEIAPDARFDHWRELPRLVAAVMPPA